MGNDYDPHGQAEEAIKEAVRAGGLERPRWFEIAQAWLELARIRPRHGGSSAQPS